MSEPYREAAQLYWQSGWRSGILPIPARTKKLVLRGLTGHEGIEPSFADIQSWMDGREGQGNIALRMPKTVIGIDVDAYGTKNGAQTLAQREHEWSALPATWRSSARQDDPVSGIRFFRIPAGLNWPGEIGANVEIVQWAHRYAVVWPSLHPEGGTYQWYSPSGQAMPYVVPNVAELPELPQAWIDHLSSGIYAPQERANINNEAVQAHLDAWSYAGTCRVLRSAETSIAARFRHGSRHEVLTTGLLSVLRLGEQGHRGMAHALGEVLAAFEEAAGDTTRGDSRSNEQLQGEWLRAMAGAVAMIVAQPTEGTVRACSCDVTLDELVPPPGVDDGRPRPRAPAPHLAWLVDAPSTPDATARPVQSDSGGSELASAPLTEEAGPPSLLDAEIARQRIQRAARAALDAEEATARFRPPVWTADLREELALPLPATRYVLPELMPADANVLLAAQFKAGKTTLINNVAKAIADGVPFLDRFQPAPLSGRVGLFNYEVSRAQYAQWLREQQIKNLENITVLPLRGFSVPITTPYAQNWVVEWLKVHEIEVWIVDPFARAFIGCGDNENDNSQVGRFLDAIDIVKERAGVASLIMPAHTGRAEQAEGHERARGATRLDDWADVRWMLTKDAATNIRYFRATGRDVEYAETGLQYDAEHRWYTIGAGNRATTREGQVIDAVVRVLRRHQNDPAQTEPLASNELRTLVREEIGKCGNDSITQAIGILKRSSKLYVKKDGLKAYHFLTDPQSLINSVELIERRSDPTLDVDLQDDH